MIALKERNTVRNRRQKVKESIDQAQQMSQTVINAVLWQIIRQNAETNEEDFDATKPAMLTVPMQEFKDVPAGFGLQVKQAEDNMIIIASPESNLILPDRKII